MRNGFKSLLMAISLMACPALAACGGDDDSDAEADASTELDASTEADASTEVDAGPSTCAHDCGEHGVCLNDGSGAMCHCVTGYAGDACDACAAGFQDNDKDGTCLPDCQSAGLSCGERQECDDSSGTAACKLTKGKWTVMVYLDGDNNLGAYGDSDYAYEDLMEMADGMKSAGEKGDDINVIVLFDETEDEDSELTDDVEDPGDTRVYKVSRDGVALLDSGNKIFRGGEADMSSSKTLQKFGTWAVENFPADHYALVLWDHGDGWRDGSDGKPGSHCDSMKKFGILPKAPAVSKAFATDDSASSADSMIHIHNGEYTDALKAIKKQAGKKIDLIGFDACLMGMYEVAVFTEPYADFMVASSETIPGTGWDYASVVGALANDPDMEASDLGEAVVDAYMDFVYEDEDSGLSIYIDPVMGLYDLSKMDALNEKLGAVATALDTPFVKVAAMNADAPGYEDLVDQITYLLGTLEDITVREGLQKFYYAEHVDLRHFLELLAEAGTEGGVSQAALDAIPAALAALEDAVPYHRNRSCSDDDDFCYFDYSYEHANGMAIFFPHGLNCRVDATGDFGPFSSAQEFYDSIEELGASSVMAYSDYLCTDYARTGLYSAWDIFNCYVGESGGLFAPGWSDFVTDALVYGTAAELNVQAE